MNRYADIALPLPKRDTFQYEVPEPLRGKAEVGRRVWAAVRGRRLLGTIVGLSEARIVEEVKPLESILEEMPLGAHTLELTRWMADYYYCSWGQAIETALPAPFKKGRFAIKTRPRKEPPERVHADSSVDYPLTPGQRSAYDAVAAALSARRHAKFLLYGVTGSGKTEVYIQLIRSLLEEGRGAIVLVPEISLTPQTVDRFHARFGGILAVVHSRLSQGQRVEEWRRIRGGEAKVVIGARSAVFSPVRDLGLIVIDEEHDTSYKQDETPRYETRRVAAERGRIEGACVLMGSATPSLEVFHECETGQTACLGLRERIEKRPMPLVEVVDMRRQPVQKGLRIFSTVLEARVRGSLARKEQVMLFLNRRGFSTHLHCASCGWVMTCPNCRTSLTYHYDRGALFCHQCEYRAEPLRLCPGCQKSYLHYFGIGTQKVEAEAARLFPGACIGRMDADSTARKQSHESILGAFKKREIDILIGTQMIAKGHDFPNVSLIGVISADTALHIPDFRAAERTFGLLTQVSGRTGRGSLPGEVIVQTFVPHHDAVQKAREHDYEGFYAAEIRVRRELALPPFTHLIYLVLSGAAEKEVVRQILGLKRILEAAGRGETAVMGPAPCLVSKLRGVYRWGLYLKGGSVEAMRPVLDGALAEFKKTRITLTVDVDPQG